jgi:hypothetical protein
VAAAGVAATALPDASTARAGASAARAASSIDRLAAGTSTPAPGTCPSATSTALGEGGAGSHLSGGRSLPPLRGACPPSLSSSSPSPDDEHSEVSKGESPCYSHSQYSSSLCSRCSRRRILCSFLRATRSCSHRCAARALGLKEWAGRTVQRSRPASTGKSEASESRRCVAEE